MSIRIIHGDCRDVLRELPSGSVQCCVTSPPYWGLRDYGVDATIWGGDPECEHEWGDLIAVNATNHTDKRRWNHTRNGLDEEQPTDKRVAWLRTKVPQGKFCQHCGAWAGALGLEPTPELFIEHIVEVFGEVRRVLRDDGILLMNLGDSYATGAGKAISPGGGAQGERFLETGPSGYRGSRPDSPKSRPQVPDGKNPNAKIPTYQPNRMPLLGLKPKDLIGIPWMAAFALRADGWWLRSDIIWNKVNPMPESVTDQPTKSHEYVFLLTKQPRYFWDAEAVREPQSEGTHERFGKNPERSTNTPKAVEPGRGIKNNRSMDAALKNMILPNGRNIRSVWTIATSPLPEAHFATFPPDLAERCILAGTSEKGCCSACGAPWARITTKGEPDMEHRRASGADVSGGYNGQSIKDHDSHGVQNASDVKRRILEGMREKSYSWAPTCKCDAAVQPCVVLDPFGGAGTVGLVADRMGRDAILIELNEDYVKMARNRVTRDSPLFAQVT